MLLLLLSILFVCGGKVDVYGTFAGVVEVAFPDMLKILVVHGCLEVSLLF